MEKENPPALFDEKLNEIFRGASDKAFMQVPELRSVIVIYDYFKNLNDAENISKGMWLHTDGHKDHKPADSIVGSMGVTLQAFAHILDELMQLHNSLSKQLLDMSKEVAEKSNQAES